MDTLEASVQSAADRIGVGSLDPALSLEAANVARDPSIVPTPIRRSEPTGEWYTAGKFGDQGYQAFNGEKAAAEQPEYFTFNGHVAALTQLFPLEANVGEND